MIENEKTYLKNVTDYLKAEISSRFDLLSRQKSDLVNLRKEVWEEFGSVIKDFDTVVDLTQYIKLESTQLIHYEHAFEELIKYRKLLPCPYFGRFDFIESGESEEEKIYIGYHNLMNDDTYDVLVYDWRTPIADLYYSHELGDATYLSPSGELSGTITRKRQYGIKNSELIYAFDSSLAITDDVLKQALGQNSSPHMHNIVSTIQEQQNRIIRNQSNDLLLVQGAAGSGKTSIALHRIAFLLYNDRNKGLTHKDVLIISPNTLFGEYISHVLPELGEKNVTSITLEELMTKHLDQSLQFESRHHQLETLINQPDSPRQRWLQFKGSSDCITLLDRYLTWFEEEGIPFADTYHQDQLLLSADELRALFIGASSKLSIKQRLHRIETILLEKLIPLQRAELESLKLQLVEDTDDFLEINRTALTAQLSQRCAFLSHIHTFTRPDAYQLYYDLLTHPEHFTRFASTLDCPSDWQPMLEATLHQLQARTLSYEDGSILLYIQFYLEGKNFYPTIKQVLIDEAQDYYPIHYALFKRLFKEVHYTLLGDYCQTIEKAGQETLYDRFLTLLMPKNPLCLSLNQCYRSTYEITQLAKQLHPSSPHTIPFERHGMTPNLYETFTYDALLHQLIQQIHISQRKGYESLVILCKTQAQCLALYPKLKPHLSLNPLLEDDELTLASGITLLPIYAAKGLEYDAVFIHDVSTQNFSTDLDCQLLYIACTRALHALSFYAVTPATPLLKGLEPLTYNLLDCTNHDEG
ncbi:MAG: HelD family protein [Cellulosilyticaceae bacterium]